MIDIIFFGILIVILFGNPFKKNSNYYMSDKRNYKIKYRKTGKRIV